jgi:hypothetical protein
MDCLREVLLPSNGEESVGHALPANIGLRCVQGLRATFWSYCLRKMVKVILKSGDVI